MKKNPKEYDKLTEEFYQVTKEKGCSEKFCKYVWEVLVSVSKGYGFNLSHTLAYSLIGLQELNLAYKYPIIFWNTANLIVDSGSMNVSLDTEVLPDNEEEEVEEEKLENSSIDYGRIATAVGKMKASGINFTLPDINNSKYTYSPDVENDTIVSGLRGITRIGNQLIKDIINNRPYNSIEDFLSKVNVNKTQMVSLVKSGSFDKLVGSREEAMNTILELYADKKNRITLQNMPSLIKYKLIPEEFEEDVKTYNFNKYIKKCKIEDYYSLDSKAMFYYQNHFDIDKLINVETTAEGEMTAFISQKTWDNMYKKEMDRLRSWTKEEQQNILNRLNQTLFNEIKEKYATGNISSWEMESLSYYYHQHEMAVIRKDLYEISDFFKLSKEPIIDRSYESKDGSQINLYKICRIAGTVIDKDKKKSTVTLLTEQGVVNVKVWKNQFGIWDRQISAIGDDGKKKVLEKSWFTRGTKLIITGIRREDNFIPKVYKNTPYPIFEKIYEIDEEGFITRSDKERINAEEE